MRCSTPRPSTRQLRRNVSSVHASGAALGDHQTDQTVVAEPVAHPDRPDLVPAAGGQRLHVGFVAADGREVELVGAQRQLRGAAQVLVAQRGEIDLELQAS